MHILNFIEACNCLRQGNIILYPTETFYAVGGMALNPESTIKVFNAKDRAPQKPLPIIIADITQLPLLTKKISEAEYKLAEQFWPGPLSILFKAGPLLPQNLTCGHEYIAIRQTSHHGAAMLCNSCGPLSASSANLSGKPAAKSPEQLDKELIGKTEGIFRYLPNPAGGLPSTLVQVLPDLKLKIVRPGAITIHELAAAGWEIAIKV